LNCPLDREVYAETLVEPLNERIVIGLARLDEQQDDNPALTGLM
jgi:hypothetical protein